MSDWLLAEGFRGHAMIPLVAEDRSKGILVLDTRQPRLLNEREMRFLCLMANQAAMAIEKARLHQEEIQRQRMEQELSLAQQIQLSLLPDFCPDVPGWEISVYYKPAHRVGGDFYDFFSLPGEPGRIGMIIADVSGKGVSAALFMVHCRTMIRTSALRGDRPADTLIEANKLILRDNRSDLFVTVFYGILDTQSGLFAYANGGHCRPLWFEGASGKFRELGARGIILGNLENIKLEERAIELTPGDVLTFYTDGVTESRNIDGALFGKERLRSAVAENPDASAQQTLQEVVHTLNDFTEDAPQSDDFTLLVVKRIPDDLKQ